MKKILFSAFCALFGAVLANAEPVQEIAYGPSDTGNIEIIDLNITPMKTNFTPDASASISAKEGTFVKVSTGSGSGKTKEEATRNAIVDATSKLKGFSTANFSTKSQKFVNELGVVENLDTQIYKASKGRIDSYEITSIETEPNGAYAVSVNVYKTLFERNEKPNLVVFNASKYKALGDSLRKYLTNELVQSKKFNVLDRKNSAYYKAEKQLIEGEDASSEDIYKLGNVLGTDYMLVFNLNAIGASAKKSVNLTANSANVMKGDVVVDYRLILFATREVKLANTLTLSITLKDDSVKSNEEAMAKIAKAIFGDISDTLYPLFVASVENKEVLFEEKLELNAIYECESKTNANSGKVQVIKANAKNSRAKIIDGEVAFNDVCRLSLEKGKDANYKLGTGGGVNLGW